MATLAVWSQAGLRGDEIGRLAAGRLGFELVTQGRLENLYRSEFQSEESIPVRGYADVVTSMVARLAVEHHLVFCGAGSQYLFDGFPGVLRVRMEAPRKVRAGALMVEQGLQQPAAVAALRQLERQESAWLRERFKRSQPAAPFDLTLNAQRWESAALAEIVSGVVETSCIRQAGLLPAAAERQLQFQVRLRLAGLGMHAPGSVALPARQFAHPSEEMFANLLDFYRIAWDYEPRSFPIDWDEQRRVTESVTPDFYLPEFDLYVELTTMKQSLVTRKNRKIKRLRELYPEVNVQVFYQKDFENLVFKYGPAETTELLK